MSFNDNQPVTKQLMCQAYGFSQKKLWQLLNIEYYKELVEVGYSKDSRILPPNVVKKFIELYGEPFLYKDLTKS